MLSATEIIWYASTYDEGDYRCYFVEGQEKDLIADHTVQQLIKPQRNRHNHEEKRKLDKDRKGKNKLVNPVHQN